MYYHAAILLLFRPFLKAKFTQSDISPSDVCRASAAHISQLFNQHHRLYDSVGLYTLQVHCLLAACTIHIINVPAIASTTFLTSAANHFHHLVPISGWAGKCIQILKDLIQRWQIVLPLDAEQALYQDTPESPAFGGDSDSGRGKRSAFALPTAPPIPQQKKPKLATPRTLNPSSTSSSSANIDPGVTSPTTFFTQMGYHAFAPFPNHPVPMLRPTHTSDSHDKDPEVLQQHPTAFDGLTFESGSEWFDPFVGYAPAGGFGEG